jgi:hypothetical protein
MTSPLPSETPPPGPAEPGSRHLRLVPQELPGAPGGEAPEPLVGYLVYVPEGTDPARLFAPDGPRPLIRPLTPVPDSTGGAGADGDDLRIDTLRRVAELDGRALDLTYLEFELLAHLVAHPDRVLSRESLIGSVWGYGHIGDGRTVDVHIARVRAKLGRAHRQRIVTVRRVGYKYTPGRRPCTGPVTRGQS